MGTVVVFLDDSSPLFAAGSGLWSIVDDAMLVTVDAGGRLGLPLLLPVQEAPLLDGTPTLAALERAAAAAPRVIDVVHRDGLPTRA